MSSDFQRGSTYLLTTTDQRHAIRLAINRAAEEIVAGVWEWDEDKIARSYDNLVEGRLTLDWTLRNPTDVEPSR